MPSDRSGDRVAALSLRPRFLTACLTAAVCAAACASTTSAVETAPAQDAPHADDATTPEPISEAALLAALEEYDRALRDRDSEALLSRTHENLARRRVTNRYWGAPSREWVRPMSREILLAAIERESELTLPKAEIVIDDIARQSGSARLVRGDRVEFVHAVNLNGRWVVSDSVIGAAVSLEADARETAEAAITSVIADYCQGFYEMDGKRVLSTCHPMLSKRSAETLPGSQTEFLSRITYEEIEMLGYEFNKHHGFEPGVARMDIEIYDIRDGIATARLTGGSWFDYLQLVRVNGSWTIINIIYESLNAN